MALSLRSKQGWNIIGKNSSIRRHKQEQYHHIQKGFGVSYTNKNVFLENQRENIQKFNSYLY